MRQVLPVVADETWQVETNEEAWEEEEEEEKGTDKDEGEEEDTTLVFLLVKQHNSELSMSQH